jgi:hypothetical protein
MIIVRRLTLAAVLAGGLLGIFMRVGPGSSQPRPGFDLQKIAGARGAQLGPFVLEAVVVRAGLSVQLRSPQCASPLFVGISDITAIASEQFTAFRYPPAEWRTFYVYRGRKSETFERFSAYLQYLVSRITAALIASSPDPSENMLFVFHTPAGCAVDQAAAIEVPQALIALTRS